MFITIDGTAKTITMSQDGTMPDKTIQGISSITGVFSASSPNPSIPVNRQNRNLIEIKCQGEDIQFDVADINNEPTWQTPNSPAGLSLALTALKVVL